MSEALWASRARPTPGPDAISLGAWTPAGLNDLTVDRRALATAIARRRQQHHANPRDGEATERLLLAFEELVSNGLRHGLPPVRAAVTAFGSWWLLEVSDAAVHHPPTPAWGRDAAHGGLGLPLVARICAAHGWHTDGARKNVWALLHQPGTRLAEADPNTAASAGVNHPGSSAASAAVGVPPARDPGGRGTGAVATAPDVLAESRLGLPSAVRAPERIGGYREPARLLVPVDGSADSGRQLVWALQEAARRDALVLAVSVLHPEADTDTRTATRTLLDAQLLHAIDQTGVHGRSRTALLEPLLYEAITGTEAGAELVVVRPHRKTVLRPVLPRPPARRPLAGRA